MNTFTLPPHLQNITRVFVDPEVRKAPLTQRIRERLPHLPWHETKEGEPVTDAPKDPRTQSTQGHTLYLKNYKGKFLRFCPGTRYYQCCGYRIVHIGENCPLTCTYCILQAYFQDRVLKVWANQNDLFTELDKAFTNSTHRYRVGTGEFTDSLALEALTGYSRDLIGFLSDYDNVCLELKSKVIDLSWMDRVKNPRRVLPAWSLNAPRISNQEEHGASTLEQRLQAAQTCAQAGYKVCLHFDPIIHYPDWESTTDGYAAIIDMIFDYVCPEQIAYMSLGSFRFMPELKTTIERNFPQTRYIYNEFISGLDQKQRLLRPLRLEQFTFMVNRLRKHGMDKQLYFCMESNEIWQTVMNRVPKDFGGLTKHLLDLAFAK